MPNSYAPIALLSLLAEESLAETRLTEAPLLGILGANARLVTQRGIKWGARLSDAEVDGRTLTGALASNTAGSVGEAKLSVPDYYFKYQLEVIKRDLVEAAATGDINAVRDAVGTEMNDALRAFSQKINSVLYTGIGTANNTHFGVIGLNEVAKQTGSYAGISRATYPRWKSIVKQGAVPGTAEEMSVERMTMLLRDRRKAGATAARNNGSQLIALTSDEIETDVLRKLYQDEAKPQGQYAELVANIAPYTGYAIQGIPVVSDVAAPTANKIYLLDPSKIQLYVFDQMGSVAMNSSKIGVINYQGLQFRMADVSDEHPDLVKMEISISMQMKAHDPIQAISVIEDVSNTYVP
jgi:hypothetical protein